MTTAALDIFNETETATSRSGEYPVARRATAAFTDLRGRRFGRLVAIAFERVGGTRRRQWRCRCDCGATAFVRASNLLDGHTRSCGCLLAEMRERSTGRPVVEGKGWRRRVRGEAHVGGLVTHGATIGGSRTPEYSSWISMHRRCDDPSDAKFYRYGGRGVAVCERWSGERGFENFFADMGPRPNGTTIDRKENDGGYEPGNCRWATGVDQARNTSRNRFLEFGGRRLTFAEWAREIGVSHTTIAHRVAIGWDAEKTVTTPPNATRRRGAEAP